MTPKLAVKGTSCALAQAAPERESSALQEST